MSSCIDDSFRCFQEDIFMTFILFLKNNGNGLSNLLFFSFSPFQKPHAKDKIYVQSQGKKFKIYIFEKKSLLSFRDMY